ncbi:glycoside hydrolase [Dentipellis sp. KUC8613]|nr:glycoside hydrolase [Dentipellis sp. KUC8613]
MRFPSSLALCVLAAGVRASPLQRRVQDAPFVSDKSVIIQMFEWTWDSIAAECTNFIGPAGYAYVQVSPAQEHVTGDQWWTDYQPVTYTLTSKRGDRTQYQNMINTCHNAGVLVIADTIWNHMAGSDSGTGVAGDTFTHYDYPGIYSPNDFHYCGSAGNDIHNYDNRTEVQECELDNLADLATETEYVRSRLAEYGNDLLSVGVDGLRLDAAKSIAATDLANITSRLSKVPYITQEVEWGAGQPIQPSEYVGIGNVQEFRYTWALQDGFLSTGISALQNLDNQGWISGTDANVFVADHDTERDNSSLNANSPANAYMLAHIFSLAHPYGRPTVLSSYTGYWNTDQGSPNSGAGTCSGSSGANGWLCQHRWTSIAGMVGFRNTVGTAALTNWVAPNSQQIAFGRGSAGFVAINNEDSQWSTTFKTSLPAGSYCDVITGASSSGSCTGNTITVGSDGSFTATIPARWAIAIHTGSVGSASSSSSSSTVALLLSEQATTTFGENIFVVGSIAELGSWDPDSAIPLSPARYPLWQATVNVPANTNFEYKFIRKETSGSVVWESDPNRSATTPGQATLSISTSWR